MPRRISPSIWRTTLCDSFSGSTFWKGIAFSENWSDHMTTRAARQRKRPGHRPGLALVPNPSALRDDQDLHPAVLGAALGGQVRGDRQVLAPAIGDDAPARNARAAQDRRHGHGPALRQVLVVG